MLNLPKGTVMVWAEWARLWSEVTRTEALPPMTAALRAGRVSFPPNSWSTDCLFYLQNNHILLAVSFSHPLHPMSKCRRVLMLLSSLSFAFFLSTLSAIADPLNHGLITSMVTTLVSALLQVAWDVPGGMLAGCPCLALSGLPVWLRRGCGCVSFYCLSCHMLIGMLYAFVGAVLLLLWPWTDLNTVYDRFAASKLLSFLLAVPINIVVFTFQREWELSQPRRDTQQRHAVMM